MNTTIRRGTRGVTTGKGNTKNGDTLYGTCMKKHGNSVFVFWDKLHIEHEMDISEVALITYGIKTMDKPIKKTKELVINTETQDEYNQLVEIMDKQGFLWNGGGKIGDEDVWCMYESETCLIYCPNTQHSERGYFEEHKRKYEIIEFSEWIKQQSNNL